MSNNTRTRLEEILIDYNGGINQHPHMGCRKEALGKCSGHTHAHRAIQG